MERSEGEKKTRSRWVQWVRDRDGNRRVHTNPARLMYRVLFVCCVRCCIARFFCFYRLLFISTNVQLYWSAIYQPRSSSTPCPSPGTPGDEFFSIWKDLSGLAERPGMEVRYDRLYDNAERWLILPIFGSVRPDLPTSLQLANNFSGIIYLLFVFFFYVQTTTCGFFAVYHLFF